jgi:exodeoxyribonuclease VII small subunit
MTGTTNASNDEAPNFEQALARLEAIVHELEEGSLGLADALARYEQGVGLLKQCYTMLEQAERKIELVSGLDSTGAPLVSPLDDQVQSLDEKSKARRKHRGAAPQGATHEDENRCPQADMDAF